MFIPFISWWVRGLHPPFDWCEQCCYEHRCTKSEFLLVILLGIYAEAELLFNFLRNRHTVFHNGRTILYSRETDNFSISLPTHFVLFFCNSHPNRWKVVSHCGFDLHFPSDLATLNIFLYAYWPFIYLFWRSVFSNPLPVLKLVV